MVLERQKVYLLEVEVEPVIRSCLVENSNYGLELDIVGFYVLSESRIIIWL